MSGSVSVKSDAAFNQTLMSIRATIDRCKQKRSQQDLRNEYQAQLIDKTYSKMAE